MPRKKLSVYVIAFNEEKNIEDCLKSITWADEIVVADSFSTDKTVKIWYNDEVNFKIPTSLSKKDNNDFLETMRVNLQTKSYRNIFKELLQFRYKNKNSEIHQNK